MRPPVTIQKNFVFPGNLHPNNSNEIMQLQKVLSSLKQNLPNNDQYTTGTATGK